MCSKGLITSHDPESGAELWRAAGVDVPAASSFAADSERLYFGLRGPKRRGPLYALRAGAEGDQSPAAGATEIRCQAWAAGAPPGLSSPVAGAGLVFTLNASILACHDAETGEFLYRERLEGLSTVAASPLLVGETLLVLDEEGSALLLRAGRTVEIVGRARLDDHFWATPALAGGVLLLRGVERLYCVR